MINLDNIYSLLSAWTIHSEKYWYDIPGSPGLGCYGSGYNAWGVQTNQKYFAAIASLATRGSQPGLVSAQWALDRALSSLRFCLASHVTGPGACTDGTQWGHTWISALGIERMMHSVYRIEPFLTDDILASLRRVLASEADWLLFEYKKGSIASLTADVWDQSGRNQPESNIWNGALLWRAAMTLPDHPHAADWQEKAHQFLVNGVSVPADLLDDSVMAGKPIRERCAGANFFTNYALDHHGYFNVGYMVICASNAAMLHFDMKMKGWTSPETLDHHQADLWQVLRRMVFQNGRLVRIGGDTRVRYAYCQEYLLPALLYAADRWHEPHALQLVEQQMSFIQEEANWNRDGSFYSHRLANLAQESEYYYTRLESDRACALAQVCAYLPILTGCDYSQGEEEQKDGLKAQTLSKQFELSVEGGWVDHDHGAVLHRSPTRLASFSWRAQGIAQGMCLPPDDGHLSDWEGNLTAQIDFIHHPHPSHPTSAHRRELREYEIKTFPGGFLTYGSLNVGCDIELAEGWRGHDMAVLHLAFAALPDCQTVLAIEFCQMNGKRGLVQSVKGMHFNLANDLFNKFSREIQSDEETILVNSPADQDENIRMPRKFVCVDRKLGFITIYGAESHEIIRSTRRKGGPFRSLYVDEICCGSKIGPFWANPNETLLDCSWAVLASADMAATRQASKSAYSILSDIPGVRFTGITGTDQGPYLMVANFSNSPQTIHLPAAPFGTQWIEPDTDLAKQKIELFTGQACLLGGQRLVTNS